MARFVLTASCLLFVGCGNQELSSDDHSSAESSLSNASSAHHATNTTGVSETFSPRGLTDLVQASNAFFADLGTNGRRCETCHRASDGFTIRPESVQARFDATQGYDPLFRLVDGANTPYAQDTTLEDRRAAYSLLLRRGVIRVGIGIPSGAQFELLAVDDPFGFATAAELSLYRRPLPATNLPFNATIMWDGRESPTGRALPQNLASQANGATQGHAERPVPLTTETAESIVEFESALFQAQTYDVDAKELHTAHGRGGPQHLALEVFDPANNVRGFDLYDAWAGLTGGGVNAARASIARGQAQFSAARPGRCTNCHDTHNIGTSARGAFFDIGISDVSRREADVPLYTLRNLLTGEVRQTTDPGRALITGLWRDVDRFKTPGLRGVVARAPYFHDGSARTLDEVLDHYEVQFGFTFTAQEQADLAAFLRAL